ncbi:MAG: transcriptional regulator, partial [Gammaproteobacteria bacterium]
MNPSTRTTVRSRAAQPARPGARKPLALALAAVLAPLLASGLVLVPGTPWAAGPAAEATAAKTRAARPAGVSSTR